MKNGKSTNGLGAEPAFGDKVFLGDVRGAFRVMGFRTIAGERAVVLAKGADTHLVPQRIGKRVMKEGREPCASVHVADLVKDTGRRGWRERWRQGELLPEQTELHPDIS